MLPAGWTLDARRMDKEAVSRGIPSLLLMENAAFSLYLAVRELAAREEFDAIVVLAGKGGNGGDGMALLRILADRGCPTPLFLVPLFSPEELSADAEVNYRLLPRTVRVLRSYRRLSGRILVVDAMLGVGISKPLSAAYLTAVRFINRYPRKRVIAADMPTGLSSDTGEALPEAVKADITVSFGLLKAGLFLGAGPDHAGEVRLGPIGVPAQASRLSILEPRDFTRCEPAMSAHKRINGRLLVIGGDPSKIGASFIVAEAFLAAGGGLATIAVPDKQLLKLAGKHPAVMLTTLDEAIAHPERWDVIVCGPGLHNFPSSLEKFICSTPARLILDAGMFDMLDKKLFGRLARKEVIFTPHPGELSRIALRFGFSGRWDEMVRRFPLGPRHILYAKNAASWIRDGKRTVILPHGARALSFGGTGDALAGTLAAFSARLKDLFQSAMNAGLLHRQAGLILETDFSSSFHRVSSLIECIGKAHHVLEGKTAC